MLILASSCDSLIFFQMAGLHRIDWMLNENVNFISKEWAIHDPSYIKNVCVLDYVKRRIGHRANNLAHLKTSSALNMNSLPYVLNGTGGTLTLYTDYPVESQDAPSLSQGAQGTSLRYTLDNPSLGTSMHTFWPN